MSTKAHDPIVFDGMVGICPREDIGGTNETKIRSGPNRFIIGELYGGMKPSVNKSSGKLESCDVQTDLVLDLGD